MTIKDDVQASGTGSSADGDGELSGIADPTVPRDFRMQWTRLLKDHWQIICLVTLTFCAHLYVFGIADQLIYDERLWVPEARHILAREPLGYLSFQTALSKLIMASGIFVLGDNPWGWRTPSALFGAASVVLIYMLAQRLAGRRTALLASLLFATENLVFTFSGLGMLDVFSVPFMLLAFLLYFNHRYALSGLSLALAVLCTPKALLAVFAILAHWALVRRKRGFREIGVFAATALVVFIVFLPITDFLATGEWLNPLGRITQMWTTQTSTSWNALTAEEIAEIRATRPWEWVLNLQAGAKLSPAELHHRMCLTPTIWIMIIPSMAYLLYRQISGKKNKVTPRFVLLWVAATYLMWIPLELITDRIMFLYYFLPTMGAICIGIGYILHLTWQRSLKVKRGPLRWSMRAAVVLYVLVHLLTFILISPLSLALVQYQG